MNCIVDAEQFRAAQEGQILKAFYIYGSGRRIARFEVVGALNAAAPVFYDGYHYIRAVLYRGQLRWLRFMRDGNAFLVPADG